MEKFILLNSTATRYSDSSTEGSVIVLLHGYMESLDIWSEISESLQTTHRVISIDLPGHGISEVKHEIHTMKFLSDSVALLLENLSISKCCMVGHSMGGYVALQFAKDYPQLLDSIVLLHSSPFEDTPERAKLRLREIELIEKGKKDILAQLNPGKCFAPQNRKPFAEDINALSEQIYLTEDEGAIAILKGMMDREPMNDMLHKLQAKQVFIFGRFDEFIPIEYAEKIAETHPQAKCVWMENSGHMSFIEQRDKVVEVLNTI